MRIAVVTDSTACIPSYRTELLGINTIPVQVILGEKTFDEGVGISSQEVVTAINEGVEVSTSRPAPELFRSLYSKLAAQGAEEIVSIHLSSELSGTYSAAVMAARESRIPVRVVDTRSVGLGLGFAVLAAAELARLETDASKIVEVASSKGRAARLYLSVDSMETLRRGGRVGTAQAMVGTALAIKPILEIVSGKVRPLEKVRTSSRALARLVELAQQCANDSSVPVQIGVQHAGAPERASGLVKELGKALPGVPVVTTDLGAVLTAHAGPGAIAVVISPR